MTLLELTMAIAVMAMVVGTLGTLGNGVQQAYEYAEGQGMATQHARVALDRITRTVNEATAGAQFPGFLVFADTVGTWQFPDTLVVWHPTSAGVDPDGLPRFSELVVYCPNVNQPNSLLEITNPSDTRTVPAVSNQTQWATEMQNLKQSSAAQVVVLTSLLRTCVVTAGTTSQTRGAVRFVARLNPPDSQWTQYQNGTLAWQNLYWAQGLYGAQEAMRQAWLRFELQLMPGNTWVANNPAAERAITFFGSAAVYYTLP
jgi:Tfp pilus assembly protein PilW